MQIGSTPPPPPPGPSQREKDVDTLEEKVDSGEISSDDMDAMMDALDAMNEARKEDGRPEPGSPPPTREEVTERFQSLLSDQVENGTISEEQADQLSEMYENGELGKPKKGPPPPGEGGQNAQADQSSEFMQADQASELMQAVLTELQSQSGYDSSGEASSDSASLLADFSV